MRTATLTIQGMHCGACVAHLEKALKAVPGVSVAAVNLATSQGRVEFDERVVGEERLCDAVTRAGYAVAPESDGTAEPETPVAKGEPEAAAWRRRVLLGAGPAAVVAALGMHVDFGLSAATSGLIQGLVALPIQVWLGRPFYAGAWRALRAGRADMDTLVAMGTTAAFLLSAWGLVAAPGESSGHGGGAHLYFDTSVVILVLIALGKWMESAARGNASSAIAGLMDLAPPKAVVLRDGQQEEVSARSLRVGETVVVKPGGRIACDGVVLPEGGSSAVDESMLTGESVAVEKRPGDTVTAGTMNQTGALLVRVSRVGAETTLSQIAKMVQEAQLSKARVQRLADAVAGVFVPVVLVLAGVTLLAWGLWGGGNPDWSRGLFASVAVLIVACPCALGLATPTAIMVGTGVGARRGILIRDATALERAGSLSVVALDKTGTLTSGRPTVRRVVPEGDGVSEMELLRLAASLEALSEHPVARAIVAEAARLGLPPAGARNFHGVPGGGIRGVVEGVPVFVGRPGDAPDGAEHAERVKELSEGGRTVVAVVEGAEGAEAGAKTRGFIVLSDTERPHAREAVARLEELGLSVVMVTGDNQAAAQAAAGALGVRRVLAGVRPGEKKKAIEDLQAGYPGQGRQIVAMVGDGVNDAPALAAADIGIAMGNGTDIAMNAGQIVLVGGELRLLPQAIVLSRAMMRRIHAGLFWAFAYNAVLLPVAALGWMHPMLAAGAMSLSSVSVVANALWLRRVRLDSR